MANMFEALSDGSLDLQNKRDLSTDFARNLVKYRDSVVSDYLKYKIDLNTAISKIAKKENLNDDQIHRIVEEVNNQVYLAEYSRLKGSTEREVNFNLASINKVKELCGGKSEKTEKEASSLEGSEMEKVASEENKYQMNIFNGPQFTYGSLAPNMKLSKEDFILNKIASKFKEKEEAMEKIAKNINLKGNILADTLVKLDRNGADSNAIFSKIARTLGLEDAEIDMVKEACVKRVEIMKENRMIPSNYEYNFELSTEKTASEIFTLGKFSLNKTAGYEKVPPTLAMNNTHIKTTADVEKIASEFHSLVSELKSERDAYTVIKEKCANSGVDIEELEKKAGAGTNFLPMF